MDSEPTTNDSQLIDGELFELVRNMKSEDAKIRVESVARMGKLLHLPHRQIPIAKLMNTGILPVLVRYLEKHEDSKLQFESAGVLITLTTEQAGAVVNAGGIPPLVAFLSSQKDDLREQAVWALGNIAGDSPFFRDQVLQAGALRPLLYCLTNSHKIGMLRISSWALSNFCRGKPPPPFQYLQPAIAVLNALLHAPDDEILTDACWALSYLTDGTNDRIQVAVNERDIVPRVVELLDHQTPSVQAPALRVIGNIVTGDENQTQTVLQCPLALPLLKKLLSHQNEGVRKESLWALSNMTAGTVPQIQAVIDSGVLSEFDALFQMEEPEISKEILTVLFNASDGGTIKQLEEMFLENVSLLDFLLESLLKNEGFQTLAMNGLINILSKASHLPSPHSFAIQISQSSFDAIGIVENLKVKEDYLKKQTQLSALLEKALAAVGSSVKPAKKESV